MLNSCCFLFFFLLTFWIFFFFAKLYLWPNISNLELFIQNTFVIEVLSVCGLFHCNFIKINRVAMFFLIYFLFFRQNRLSPDSPSKQATYV